MIGKILIDVTLEKDDVNTSIKGSHVTALDACACATVIVRDLFNAVNADMNLRLATLETMLNEVLYNDDTH